MTPATILNRAADRLEKPGAWGQGLPGRQGGAVCALAAIRDAAETCSEANAAQNVLRRLIDNRYIADWNDVPGRTQSEVVTTLREAAKMAGGA